MMDMTENTEIAELKADLSEAFWECGFFPLEKRNQKGEQNR